VTVGSPELTLGIVRRGLLWVLAFAFVGLEAELLLLGHTEEWTQWIPVVGLGLALLALGVVALRPSRLAVQLFRILMGLLIVAGIAGLILHYRGNAEFELETRPSMAGLELIRKSLTGATPALAPGSLVPLGWLGLIAVWKHPKLEDVT